MEHRGCRQSTVDRVTFTGLLCFCTRTADISCYIDNTDNTLGTKTRAIIEVEQIIRKRNKTRWLRLSGFWGHLRAVKVVLSSVYYIDRDLSSTVSSEVF